jgi:hypothetical protein
VGALTRLAAVAGVVLLAALGATAPPVVAAPPEPLSVHASFAPVTARFGDRIVARVTVIADAAAVETGRLRVIEDVAPLTPLGATRVTRTVRAGIVRVTYELPAVCISDACLAPLHLPPVVVEAPTRDGGTSRIQMPWPVLRLGSRVRAADLARPRPLFRRDVSAPAATYRVAPRVLSWILDAVAAILAAAGVALAARQAAVLAGRRRSRDTRSELERALAGVRATQAAPPEQRRRAVGLLARLLVPRDPRLADDASDLAWSEPKPVPEQLAGLADRVGREVEL